MRKATTITYLCFKLVAAAPLNNYLCFRPVVAGTCRPVAESLLACFHSGDDDYSITSQFPALPLKPCPFSVNVTMASADGHTGSLNKRLMLLWSPPL
jgi:hypothetical protein